MEEKKGIEKFRVEWNGEIRFRTPDCYSHLLGLTLQIRVHDCDMVVAANNIAERGEALFYALDFDFGRKRVTQMLQFLVCGGCGDEKTFAVTEGTILAFALFLLDVPSWQKDCSFELAMSDSPDD